MANNKGTSRSPRIRAHTFASYLLPCVHSPSHHAARAACRSRVYIILLVSCCACCVLVPAFTVHAVSYMRCDDVARTTVVSRRCRTVSPPHLILYIIDVFIVGKLTAIIDAGIDAL
eukprot:9489316-Pyramimonas_sp.AAC.2